MCHTINPSGRSALHIFHDYAVYALSLLHVNCKCVVLSIDSHMSLFLAILALFAGRQQVVDSFSCLAASLIFMVG